MALSASDGRDVMLTLAVDGPEPLAYRDLIASYLRLSAKLGMWAMFNAGSASAGFIDELHAHAERIGVLGRAMLEPAAPAKEVP